MSSERFITPQEDHANYIGALQVISELSPQYYEQQVQELGAAGVEAIERALVFHGYIDETRRNPTLRGDEATTQAQAITAFQAEVADVGEALPDGETVDEDVTVEAMAHLAYVEHLRRIEIGKKFMRAAFSGDEEIRKLYKNHQFDPEAFRKKFNDAE